jgi:hypothetical protein
MSKAPAGERFLEALKNTEPEPVFFEDMPPEPDEPSDEPSDVTTWEPWDLGPYLRGEIEPSQPSLGIYRSDRQQFIYPGLEHSIVGATESGKTWFALQCAATELNVGRPVIYIHYEECDPASTVERLRKLGVGDDVVTLFRFVTPSRPVRAEWVAELLRPAPVLVVHDGVNEAMYLHGAEIKAAEGASLFRRRLVIPFVEVGAAVLACDHIPMGADPNRLDAYGSVHKGNALNGARIALENKKPFGRGLRGVSNVFVTKDRPGSLRASGRSTKTPGKTYVGSLVGDDTDPFEPFALNFYAPKDDDSDTDKTTTLADTILAVIDALEDQTVGSSRMLFAEMRKAGYKATDAAMRSALDDLIVDGRITEVRGANNSRGYRSASEDQSKGGAS